MDGGRGWEQRGGEGAEGFEGGRGGLGLKEMLGHLKTSGKGQAGTPLHLFANRPVKGALQPARSTKRAAAPAVVKKHLHIRLFRHQLVISSWCACIRVCERAWVCALLVPEPTRAGSTAPASQRMQPPPRLPSIASK